MPQAVPLAIYEFIQYAGYLTAYQLTAVAVAAAVISSYEIGEYQRRKALRAARDAFNASLTDRTIMADLSDGPRSRVYGRVRNVDGVVFKATHGVNSEFYTLVVSLAGHEVDAIETIYANDLALTLDGSGFCLDSPYALNVHISQSDDIAVGGTTGSITLSHTPVAGSLYVTYDDASSGVPGDTVAIFGTITSVVGLVVNFTFANYVPNASVSYQWIDPQPKLKITKYLGGPSQDLSSTLLADFPDLIKASDKFANDALIVVQMEYNTDAFAGGVPQFSAVIRGAKVYDPRNSTTVWSENPALIARDWALYAYGGDISALAQPQITLVGTVTQVSAGAISKSSGSNAWDSGFYSTNAFTGGAYVSFKPGSISNDFIVGINSDPLTNSVWTSVDYGLLCNSVGDIYIAENGTLSASYGAYSVGDTLAVKYDGATISYLKNGSVLHSHSTSAGQTLYADGKFYGVNAKITNLLFGPASGSIAQLDDVSFAAAANVCDVLATFRSTPPVALVGNMTQSSGDLEKSSGTAAWDSGFYSNSAATGGAYVSFKPSTTNKAFCVGLNSDPLTDSVWTSVDYGFLCSATDEIFIAENGSLSSTYGAYTTSDTLAVKYDGATVTYLKNGVSLHSHSTSAGQTLYADGKFYDVHAKITALLFGPVQSTYACGIVCKLDGGDPVEAFDSMTESMAGKWGWAGGKLRVIAGSYTSPVATITEDWIADTDGISISPAPARNDLVNSYRVSIADSTQNYTTVQVPPLTPLTYLTADGAEYAREISFSGVTSPSRALHVAGCLLRDARQSLNVKLPCKLHAYTLELFDTVTVTLPRFGWSAKAFQVLGWQFSMDGGVNLQLKETDASIWTPDASFAANGYEDNTQLPSPWIVAIPHITSVTSTSSDYVDGQVVTKTLVSWNPIADQAVTQSGRVEVLYTDITTGNAGSQQEVGSATSTLIIGLLSGHAYIFTARSINGLGVRSEWSLQYVQIISTPPALAHSYRAVATGASDTASPAVPGLYSGLTGTLISSYARSYNVDVFSRATGLLLTSTTYDVYAGTASAAMASALNALGNDVIIDVRTADEPQLHRLDSGLDDAMYRCGASRGVYGSPEFKSRSAYVLVGIPGCGEGNGFEQYQGDVDSSTDAWVDVSFDIRGGNLLVTGNSATPRTLADYSYVGDLNATRNRIWRTATDPVGSGAVDGDIWQNTTDGNEYKRIGGVWYKTVGDGSIITDQLAGNAATYAQATALITGSTAVGVGGGTQTDTVATLSVTNATGITIPIQYEALVRLSHVSWDSSYPSVAKLFVDYSSSSSGSGSNDVMPHVGDLGLTYLDMPCAIADQISLLNGDTLTVNIKTTLTHTTRATISYTAAQLRLTAIRR